MTVKILILPNSGHSDYKDQRRLLDGLQRKKISVSGVVTTVGDMGSLQKTKPHAGKNTLQGLYIYRNQRLIDYAGESVWKTIQSMDAKATHHRWEVHLPPGLGVGTKGPS